MNDPAQRTYHTHQNSQQNKGPVVTSAFQPIQTAAATDAAAESLEQPGPH